MSYSFETIDNKVLTSTNKVDIPDWIDNIAFKEKVDRQFDLDSDANIINQKHVIASRSDNNLAFVREIKHSFDDKTLKNYAIIKLSSFLRKYRYSVNNTEINDNHIKFDVNFDQNPATYSFSFFTENGKIKNNKLFTASLNGVNNEYPFSEAGLSDSFEDAKNNFNKKESYQVKQSNKQFAVMTRYEIVKRCNNSLEKASELINKHLKEGNIVGVGSNEFASYYDMNFLFPDLRKQYQPQQKHIAEYVDNVGQSIENEHKTEERLALEASKIISNDFNLNQLISQNRRENEFIVNAEIVNDNIRKVIGFVFDIENEKLSLIKEIRDNDNVFSVDEYKTKKNKIASYTKDHSKLMKNKFIFSSLSLKDKLENVINENHINDLIAFWQSNKLINRIETNKFASKYSLNELLDKSDVSFLNDKEIESIVSQKQRFGNNSRFYQLAVRDNDTRTKVALYEKQSKIDKIASYINQYLNDFSLDLLSNEDINIVFVINEKPNNIYAKVKYENDDIKDIICKIGNRFISINDSKNIFQKSKLLKSYLKDNNSSNHYNIIISKSMIYNKLKDYLNISTIDDMIQYLLNEKELKHIESNKYASSKNFEQLINMCNKIPIDNLRKENLSMADKTSGLKFSRRNIEDNDTRNKELLSSLEDYAYKVNSYINKYVDKFIVNLIDKYHANINLCGKDVYASIISNENNEIEDIICDVNNKKISISKLKTALEKSKLLDAYLKDNKETKHQGILISRKAFNEKLRNYISEKEISALISYLEDNKQIKRISSDKFVSNVSFDELIRDVKYIPNKNFEQKYLKLSDRTSGYEFDKRHVLDNDNRKLIKNIKTSDCKNYILSNLPRYIELKNVKNISINDNLMSSELELFNNKKGLSTTIQCIASIDNSELNNIKYYLNDNEINIDDAFNTTLLAEKLIDSSNDKYSYCSIIINKNDLKEKLKYLTDEKLIEDEIEKWSKNGKIEKIDSNTFASKYSLNELVSMSNLRPYKEDVTEQKYLQSKRQKDVIPKSYHANNFEAKILSSVNDGKTLDAFNESKNKVLELAKDYLNKQVITANKLNKIKKLINDAKTANQLNSIYKDLQRYFR